MKLKLLRFEVEDESPHNGDLRDSVEEFIVKDTNPVKIKEDTKFSVLNTKTGKFSNYTLSELKREHNIDSYYSTIQNIELVKLDSKTRHKFLDGIRYNLREIHSQMSDLKKLEIDLEECESLLIKA